MTNNLDDKISNWDHYDPERPIPASRVPDLFIFMLRNYLRSSQFDQATFKIKNISGQCARPTTTSCTPQQFRSKMLGSGRAGGLIRPGEKFYVEITPRVKENNGKGTNSL